MYKWHEYVLKNHYVEYKTKLKNKKLRENIMLNNKNNLESDKKKTFTIIDESIQPIVSNFVVVNNKDKYLFKRELAVIFIMLEWAWRFTPTFITQNKIEDICNYAGVRFFKEENSKENVTEDVSIELIKETRRKIERQISGLIEPVVKNKSTIGFKINPEKFEEILKSNNSLEVFPWYSLSGNRKKKARTSIPYNEILSLYHELKAEVHKVTSSTQKIIQTLNEKPVQNQSTEAITTSSSVSIVNKPSPQPQSTEIFEETILESGLCGSHMS